jgi:hypothetical protein
VSPHAEKRLLQAAVAIACVVPLSAGLDGVIESAAMLKNVPEPLPRDLDSHYRYLSGLLLGIGFVFAFCLYRIEGRALIFRTLGAVILVGGAARLLSLASVGAPSGSHRFALVMELVVVPVLVLWQARVARRVKSSHRAPARQV